MDSSADNWQVWASPEAERFSPILNVVQYGISNLTRGVSKEIQVLPLRWDTPGFSLVFESPGSGGVWNTIHVTLLAARRAYRLRTSCAAWRDEQGDTPGLVERVWCHSSPRLERAWQVDFPRGATEREVDRSELEERVSFALRGAYDAVTSWRWERLWLGEGLQAEERVVFAT